jgi:hypothetical protein
MYRGEVGTVGGPGNESVEVLGLTDQSGNWFSRSNPKSCWGPKIEVARDGMIGLARLGASGLGLVIDFGHNPTYFSSPSLPVLGAYGMLT